MPLDKKHVSRQYRPATLNDLPPGDWTVTSAPSNGLSQATDTHTAKNVTTGTKKFSATRIWKHQELLSQIIVSRYPEAKSDFVPKHHGYEIKLAYELDIAIEKYKVGIECDSWEYHGRFYNGYRRDREKDRALLEIGWLVIRIDTALIVDDYKLFVFTRHKESVILDQVSKILLSHCRR